MPISVKRDNENGLLYVQWDNHGHKYYFNSKSVKSFRSAVKQCQNQVRAIYANGYHGL